MTASNFKDSFGARGALTVGESTYQMVRLHKIADAPTLARLPFSLKILLENLARNRRRRGRAMRGRHRGPPEMGPGGRARSGDRVSSGARAAARFYRRAGGRRSGRHARGVHQDGRRPAAHQSAGADGSGHRPLGAGRSFRHALGLRAECRARVPAQPGALPAPALGAAGVSALSRRAAGDRHLPPGQPRVPGRGSVPGR